MYTMKKTLCLWVGMGLVAASGLCEEMHVEDHGHEYHKHHVAVFLGNTHDYHSEDTFTVGVDYEYRFSQYVGLGALVDFAGTKFDITVLGGGLFFHPWNDLRVLAAGGNEHHSGDDEFLVRLGVMYDFFINDWSVSPTVNVDLLESGHENWIYGIALGRGF